MTVRKSPIITELDAGILQTTDKLGGGLYRIAASHAKAAGQSTNDIYPLMRLWTGWTIDSFVFATAAWGTSGVVEIGCYDTEANGAAAIDADCFASALDVSAPIARIDLLMESAVIDYDEINNSLRDILGIANTVPHKWVDLCLTATHIGASQNAKFAGIVRYIEH